jgi:hypothetical protein
VCDVRRAARAAVNYFHCVEIVQALEARQRESGANVKNIFGSYTSDLLRTWDGILKAYRKNNVRASSRHCPALVRATRRPLQVFLAEAGRLLAQGVNFDVYVWRRCAVPHGKWSRRLLMCAGFTGAGPA